MYSQAIKLMTREADPEGERTLAVITKPDNIPIGQHESWMRLVTSPEPFNQLALGYWVVKNPGQDRLNAGITFSQARAEESEFFRSDTHWSTAPRDRTGAYNLRAGLSSVLVEQVQRQLPEITTSAKRQLEAARLELSQLPKPPSDDPLFELDGLLRAIAKRLRLNLRPENGSDVSLHRDLMKLYNEFADSLRSGMPVFYAGGWLLGALSPSRVEGELATKDGGRK